jgi:hypothetical protein
VINAIANTAFAILIFAALCVLFGLAMFMPGLILMIGS